MKRFDAMMKHFNENIVFLIMRWNTMSLWKADKHMELEYIENKFCLNF